LKRRDNQKTLRFEKNIKTGLADIPQTLMLTKKRQGVRKKDKKELGRANHLHRFLQ
jgi:hypothetical protein